MDFEKILAQASSNAAANRKELKRADRQVESEKRRSMELLTQRKRAEKEELRRRLPPKLAPLPESKFVIPKKAQNLSAAVDKNKLVAFLQRQEQEKKDQQRQKQKEKEELIRLRIEASGGKANKKIAKHFGKSPLELQRRFAHNPDHEDILIQQEKREQEEHDRLSDLYRKGVYRALNKKAEVLASHGKSSSVKTGSAPSNKRLDAEQLSSSLSTVHCHSATRPNFSSGGDQHHAPTTKTNGGTKTSALKPKKRKPASPSIADFSALMQKAQMNSGIDPEAEFDDFVAPSGEARKKSRPLPAPGGVGLTAGLNLAHVSKRSSRDAYSSLERSTSETRVHKMVRKEAPNLGVDCSARRPGGGFKTNGMNGSQQSAYAEPRRDEPLPSKSQYMAASKPKPDRIVVDPESGPMREKRYLPGDIRAGKSAATSATTNGAASKRYLPDIVCAKQMTPHSSVMSSASPSQAVGLSRQTDVRPATGGKWPAIKSQPASSDSRKVSGSRREDYDDFESALARKRRELEEMERAYANQRQSAGGGSSAPRSAVSRERKTMVARSRPEQRTRYDEPRYSNSRIPARNRSRSPAVRYPTYSESDEDEEEYEVDDDYDSDMADFIDDSNFDDDTIQREDFEASLRMINPHYDKKKWMMREKMISDRHMDARFKDVELEERQSARIGFYEDVKEARRGSKALA